MEIDLSKHRQYRYQKTRLPKRKPNPGCRLFVWSVKPKNAQIAKHKNWRMVWQRKRHHRIFAAIQNAKTKIETSDDKSKKTERKKNYSAVKLHNIQMTTTIFITVNKNPVSSQRDNAHSVKNVCRVRFFFTDFSLRVRFGDDCFVCALL